jgi:hypothetical protein
MVHIPDISASKEVKESTVLRDLLHYVVINLPAWKIRRLLLGLLQFLSCFSRGVNAVRLNIPQAFEQPTISLTENGPVFTCGFSSEHIPPS